MSLGSGLEKTPARGSRSGKKNIARWLGGASNNPQRRRRIFGIKRKVAKARRRKVFFDVFGPVACVRQRFVFAHNDKPVTGPLILFSSLRLGVFASLR